MSPISTDATGLAVHLGLAVAIPAAIALLAGSMPFGVRVAIGGAVIVCIACLVAPQLAVRIASWRCHRYSGAT